MNREEFIHLLEYPSAADSRRIGELREITDLFPWFHAGHLLLLKALVNSEDIRFEAQLRQSAVRIPDREVLYHLLYSDKGATAGHEDNANGTDNKEVKDEPDLSPPVNNQAGTRSREDLIREVEERLAEIEKRDIEEREMFELDESEEEITEVPATRPSVNIKLSNDLLVIDEPASSTESAELAESSKKPSQADLIERFILTNPRIEPRRDMPLDYPDPLEEKEGPGLVTETLARIYTTQGYYTKAINIYEKLCLKFPEKSDYFATQIKQIEELIK